MLKLVCAGLTLAIAGCGAASAATRVPAPDRAADIVQAPIVLVAGGCGIGFHRGPYGGCRPNGPVIVEPRVVAPVRLPPPCPPGYYRDPRPRVQLCYPRF